MDLKSLTGTQIDKALTESGAIKPSIASSDNPPSAGQSVASQIRTLQSLMQHLQLGKVFDVVVSKVEGNTVFLNIPGESSDIPLLQAELKNPPPVGTRLTLQVTTDEATPQLKVIATPNSPQDPISQNLRASLQKQQAIPPLLANLNVLAKTPTKIITPLPDEVIEVSRSVVQQLPDAKQVSQAQGLKQALQQSGPFLEHALANNKLLTGARPELKMPFNPAAALKLATQSITSATQAIEEEGIKAQKEINAATAQIIQNVVQSMRHQPVQDVRANLLRLAVLLRSLAAENSSQTKTTPTGENTATTSQVKMPPLNVGLAPLSSSTKTEAGQTTSSQTTMTNQQPVIQNTFSAAIKSQMPRAQSQAAQASLTALLTQEAAIEELLGQVESALSRINVQQLQTLATDQQQRPTWVIELPVRTEQGIDLFDLRIRRDANGNNPDDPEAPWTVTLAFDLDRMGPVRVQITLYGEEKISAVIWAEQRATSILFNHYLDNLKSRLRQAGLDVGQLNCRCGKPEEPSAEIEPRLVDEKV
ncbi:MAG: flagellar hook-length control protein FliK [Gammaproteobacteria bacterium]|nr:flagellar hook-length control protein FliK [Gammaproteobacteria bacterium]